MFVWFKKIATIFRLHYNPKRTHNPIVDAYGGRLSPTI